MGQRARFLPIPQNVRPDVQTNMLYMYIVKRNRENRP